MAFDSVTRMTIQDLKGVLEKAKTPRFCSVTYTSKNRGETANYILLLNADYKVLCRKDISTLKKRLIKAAQSQKLLIGSLISSLKESIAAMNEGREHIDYTKKGLYVPICQGLKVAVNDMTCEIQGLEISRKVIVPGKPSEPKSIRSFLRQKYCRTGKFRTLAVDLGHFHSARINGETLELL